MFVLQKSGVKRVWIACAFEMIDEDSGEGRTLMIIDPAIDVDRSDLVAYRDSFWDTAHLVVKQGEEPSWFEMVQMTARQLDACDGMSAGSRKRAAWNIRAALRDCGLKYRDRNGVLRDVQKPKLKENGSFGQMVTEKWMSQVNLPPEIIYGLSHMIQHNTEGLDPLSRSSDTPSGESESSGVEIPEQKSLPAAGSQELQDATSA